MIIQDKQHSVIVACVAFFLLVLGIFFFQNDDINRDGVGYLIQANLIEQQQQQLAKTLYPNLGFASLIATVKQQLGFGLHQTAMLLNMIFLFGSLTFFLIILKQVNSDYRLRVMAILTIAASIPLMDTYLSMIIRDHGFWCMSLMGLCCLTLWMNSKKMIWTLFAYLSFILAAFFRPEAMAFVVASPFIILIILLHSGYSLYEASTHLRQTGILCLIVILGFFMIQGYTELFANLNMGRYDDIISRPFAALQNFNQPLPIETKDLWLTTLLDDFAFSNKLLLLSNAFLQKWFSSLGIVYFCLFIFGLKVFNAEKDSHTVIIKKLLLGFALLTAGVVLINLWSVYVITVRYLGLHLWILYFFIAFGLYHIFFNKVYCHRYARWPYLQKGLIVILCLMVLNSLFDKPHVNREKAVADWFARQNIPSNQIFVEDLRIRYYMDNLSIAEHSLRDLDIHDSYDYFVATNPEAVEFFNKKKYKPIYQQPIDGQAKIIVYKRELLN